MNNEAEKPGRSAAYWILMLLLGLFLAFSIVLNIGLGIALVVKDFDLGRHDDAGTDEFPEFQEEWSYGDGDVKVVRLALEGIITRQTEGGLFNIPRDPIEELIRGIRAAANDDDVKAIILEVNSPGGGITPSDEIYSELLKFKESAEGRKVVIFMRDLTASGGYYVSMAGDWLIAEPTTVVGSIGVIMQTLNWKVLSDKIGVTDTTIKSGANKDMLNPFRESNPEEIALLQDMIDRMYKRFRALVSAGRGIPDEELEGIADGRIFTAGQALELKLIDQVGYWDTVVEKTAELLDVDQVKVVRYYKRETFWDSLAGIRGPHVPILNSVAKPAQFQYLWQP